MGWVGVAEKALAASIDALPLAESRLKSAGALEKFVSEARELFHTGLPNRLQGERPVLVESMSTKDNHLSLAKNSVRNGRGLEVRLDDKRLGKFDSWGGVEEGEFPLNIRTTEISLSNRVQISSTSRNLEVISGWQHVGGGSVFPEKTAVFSSKPVTQQLVSGWERLESTFPRKTLTSPITDARSALNWNEIGLRAGDQVSVEYPFQWAGDRLTNGMLQLPRLRPEGTEWNSLPLSSVPKQGWQPFLDALEGKYLDDLLPLHRKYTQIESNSAKTQLTARQKEVQSLLKGQMWNGGEGVQRLSTNGNAVVFKAARSEGEHVYVVDNPGVGALYVFDKAEDALGLAVGTKARLELRKDGAQFIVHSGDWQERLRKAISKF
ncbi:MAG: hypothetical protein K2X81_07255 [Candidatus Obscuribacterales bacterium]|nr:hypothetical protein [Candidatus Obscuribacterales bacterium]